MSKPKLLVARRVFDETLQTLREHFEVEDNPADTVFTPTQLAQLSVTSPLAGPVFWRARLGYSRSSGLQGPDYRYRYVTQELFVPF